MNPLGSFGSSGEGDDGGKKPQAASMTELFSSAKVVTEAAQATFAGEKEKVDQGKAAGAAADLLGGASRYGKLDDQGVGGYVKKAETYLHEYEASHSTKPGGAAAPAQPNPAPAAAETAPPGGEGEKKESNYGDYMKMAQGFLK